MKFQTKVVNHQGKQYHFVTRANAKPISDEEVKLYFDTNQYKDVAEGSVGVSAEKPKLVIPDTLKKIFLSDLRIGLTFCCKKYGASEQEILDEARRLAPEINLDLLIKRE
jgi:hypothetical protein